MRRFLLSLYFVSFFTLPGVTAAESKQDSKIYLDKKIGVSFSYPEKFRPGICAWCEENEPNCIGFIPASKSDNINADCSFSVSLDKGTLEDGASRAVNFEKTDHGWAIRGRADSQPAKAISSNGLTGLFGGATCGTSDELGFHSAAGECFTAVLSDGSRNVIIRDNGILGEKVVYDVATSLRFIKAERTGN